MLEMLTRIFAVGKNSGVEFCTRWKPKKLPLVSKKEERNERSRRLRIKGFKNQGKIGEGV